MIFTPVTTEKSVKMLELENIIVFIVDRRMTKKEIKDEVEKLFSVKVGTVNSSIRQNKKYAYVRLKKEFPAIDLATKLGMI